MDSLDFFFDDPTDASIRAEWQRLLEAGLPSLALHQAPSNRPHLTLVTAPSLAPEVFPGLDERVAKAVGNLDVPLVSKGMLLLGPRRDRYVLTRHVASTPQLLELRQRILSAIHPLQTPVPEQRAEGGLEEVWIPHITLSRRLTAEQVGTALKLLGPAPAGMRIVGLRRWDQTRETVTRLA